MNTQDSSFVTLQSRTLGLLEEYQQRLETLDKLLEENTDASSITKLLLQLRQDHEDILKKTVHLHKNLCKALGIESQNLAHDQERAHFALGILDLQKKLKNLAHLAHLLSDLLGLIQKINHLKEKAVLQGKKQVFTAQNVKQDQPELQVALKSVLDLQLRFQHSLEQLTQALQRYPGLPEFGILFNHIAGIQQVLLLQDPKPEPQQIEQTAKWARFLRYR